MWKCKHCNNKFDFERTTDKANHSRHCDKNPKKLESYKNLKEAQLKVVEKKLGKVKSFNVKCHNCGTEFIVDEREKQFPIKEKYFCSQSCANSEGGKANVDRLEEERLLHYRTLAKRHHKEKCIKCGFYKILDVHHVNEDNSDNRKENLVFLCPNHHEMFHSKDYRYEIEPVINEYLHWKWGI